MLESINSLLALTMLALAAYGAGWPLARLLRIERDDRLAEIAWGLALGLVAWGLFLTLLGLVGWLYRPLIGAGTWCGGCWGLANVIRAWRERRSAAAQPDQAPLDDDRPVGWVRWGLMAAAGMAAAAALIASLAPPTAGDALCYHLELPKVFLANHALVFLPDSDNATFPLLAEMWFLWGLALEGGVTAQLVHWGLGVLLALAAVLLATPLLGRSWAWAAGAIVLVIPGVSNQMAAPLNDLALATMTTFSLAAWRRALRGEGNRWFVAAGAMLGAALGVKYLGLVFLAAVAPTWIWSLVRQEGERRRLLAGGGLTLAVAMCVGGVWYARAAWHRGNPVWPFFAAHTAGLAPDALPASKTPLSWSPWDLVTAPWQATMSPDRFGGRGHQLGPLLLMTLPALLVVRRLRSLGSLLAVAGSYWLVWYALRQNVRFLLPLAPLLAVATVWVWIEMRRGPAPARWAVALLMAAAVALGVAAPLKRSRDKLAVAAGWESREDFLRRVEPAWQAAEWANRALRPTDRILSQDYRAFYFQAPVTRENIYRRRTNYDRVVPLGADLGRVLRGEGFTHLLLVQSLSDEGAQFDPTLSRLAIAQMDAEQRRPASERGLELLTTYDVRDSDGGLRRYQLVRLR